MTAQDHHEVVTAVLVGDGRALLCHRHPNRRWYPNVWDLPGGHIENGESAAEALERELREELGIDVVLKNVEPFKTYRPTSDLTMHAWIITEWRGDLTNLAPDEHDDLGWFGLGDLASLHLALPEVADLCRAGLGTALDPR